ncbi:zinc-containing alcohol dehydrogenase family protein [Pleurotus pulmonarius]
MASLPNLPETFKAVRCSKPNDPWEIIEVPLRAPKENEVLIRVHASGVCNSEHFVKEGTWPGLQYPRTPGHEVIGRVAAVGTGILAAHGETGRFKLGALGDYWICPNGDFTGFTVDGGHAEYMYAPETMVIGIEEEALQRATYAELAPLFCAGATVFDAIRTTKWSPGDICVVQGIGGLGHLAVQFAAKMGLKVYAVSSGASKKDLAISLGAHEHIDSNSTDVVKYVQALGGAQVIVCTAPYAQLISDIIPAVAKNGTVTLVSAATDKPIEVWNLTMNMNRATIRGWCCGCAQDMEKCVKFATQTDIKTMVQEYTLDQFADAYDASMQNKARFRNVIVFK